MPLDEMNPTIDSIYRTLKAVELVQGHSDSMIIMTGGKTFGIISEAEMMGVLAVSRGVNPKQILLEENSKTTEENAQFSVHLLKNFPIQKTYVISKNEHLEWAVPYFKKYNIFKDINPIDCGVTFEQIISNMENY